MNLSVRNNWQILCWQFEQPLEFLYHLELWLYGCVCIFINIGKFYKKLTIASINSSPINCLVWCNGKLDCIIASVQLVLSKFCNNNYENSLY